MRTNEANNILASLILHLALSETTESGKDVFEKSKPNVEDDTKTPCDVARLGDDDFGVQCFIGYSEKRYLCDPDQRISAKEMDRIENDILSAAAFYRYCLPCTNQGPCDYAASIGAKKGNEEKAITVTMTREQQVYYDRFIRKRDAVPSVYIAVDVYSKLVHPRSLKMLKKYLPCALPHLDAQPLNEDQLISAYGRLTEERWRTGHNCNPNLTILVLLGEKVGYLANGDRIQSYGPPRIYVQHTFDQKSYSWLHVKIDQLINELNGENSSSLSSGSIILYKFLDKFTSLYKESHRRRRHTIPLWAAVTFGVCSVLSICAVLLGNFVTSADRRGSRKSKSSSKPGKSKWRAGFSGGMWASV